MAVSQTPPPDDARDDSDTSASGMPESGNPMLEAALAYAARGWHVFPLHSAGRQTYCDCGDDACPSPAKHPWTRNGLKDATSDPTRVTAWWRKWPHANIGVACGASGLVVLDVDPRHGGDNALIELVKRHGHPAHGALSVAVRALCDTLTSETGGGGEHYVYRLPELADGASIRNATNLDGLRGLDVRATGGYFVAPPSMHTSGARYLWRDGALDPCSPSDWLIPLLMKRPSRATETTQPVRMFTPRDQAETGAYWVDRALRLAMEGNRNDRGFWLACQLRDSGIPEETAAGMLDDYAARTPGVGYTSREALQSLHSAYRGAVRDVARSASASASYSSGLFSGSSGSFRDNDSPAGGAFSEARTTEAAGRSQGGQAGEQLRKPSRFRFLSDEDVERLPAPVWLVNGLLVEGQRSMLFGEPGSYKSFLALDLALCIATGTSWHGHETQPGRVVYIAGEGKGGIGKRIMAWKLYHGYTGSAPISILGEAAQLLRGEDVLGLIDAIHTLPEAPAAIFFDTLARSIVGGDENSAQDMGKVIAAVDTLHSETGAHIFLIHHKARGGKNARGSTAVPGGMDTMIDLSRDGQIITMRCEKQKEAAEFQPMQLRFQVTLASENPLESSGVLIPTGVAAGRRMALPQSAITALTVLRPVGSLGWTPWRDEYQRQSGQSASSFANAIRTLEVEGLVIKNSGIYRATIKGENWKPDEAFQL